METSPSSSIHAIVALGGGSTGHNLTGIYAAHDEGLLPTVDRIHGYALVGVADSGGGTGYIRQLYPQVPAVGDVGRSIAALSANTDAAGDLTRKFGPDDDVTTVSQRFDQLEASLSYTLPLGDTNDVRKLREHVLNLAEDIAHHDDSRRVAGLSLSHLMLVAMSLESDLDQAALDVGNLMQTRAEVIPVSIVPHTLVMRDGDTTIVGEHAIDEHIIQYPDDVAISVHSMNDEPVVVNPRAAAAVAVASCIFVGPGSVYPSIGASLEPEGLTDAISERQAAGTPITIVGNLENQDHETPGWPGSRYVREIERMLGLRVDQVIFNDNIDQLHKAVVLDREELEADGYTVHAVNMVGEALSRDPNDTVTVRTEITTDTRAAARILFAGNLAVVA